MPMLFVKQGQQGPQKLSSLKNLKLKTRYQAFSLLHPSEMGSLPNFRWQNCKKRPNRFINNGDMAKIAK